MSQKRGTPPGWSPGRALENKRQHTARGKVIYHDFGRKFQPPHRNHLAEALSRVQAYGRAIQREQIRQSGRWPDAADFNLKVTSVTSATARWS